MVRVHLGGDCNPDTARDRSLPEKNRSSSSQRPLYRSRCHTSMPIRILPCAMSTPAAKGNLGGVSVRRHISASSTTHAPAGQRRACCTMNSMKEVFAAL